MKVSRKLFERVFREELIRHIGLLREDEEDVEEPAPDEDPQATRPKEKGTGKVPTKRTKEPDRASPKSAKGEPPKLSPPPAPEPGTPPVSEPEAEPDPVDPEAEEGDEEPDATPGGDVNRLVAGKTVQSISIEPKSKLLPGAKEVTLTWNETPDPLKILVTATGQIKFAVGTNVYDLP